MVVAKFNSTKEESLILLSMLIQCTSGLELEYNKGIRAVSKRGGLHEYFSES